jgi:hypothetical protein
MTRPVTSNAPARISYSERRFRPVGDEPAPDGTPTSLGAYHQDGDLVWAEFSGTAVRAGRLVGTCGPDGVIDAVYCMVTADGRAIAGGCVSTPVMLDDGRIRLIERWRRLDGESGVSEIEEVAV